MKTLIAIIVVCVIIISYNIWVSNEQKKAFTACLSAGNSAIACHAAQRGEVN